MMKKYKYGMRLRPCGISCQPEGFTDCLDGDKDYWNYLLYDRKLTDDEIRNYELDYIEEKETDMENYALANLGNEEIMEALGLGYNEELLRELLDRAGIDAVPTKETAPKLIEQAREVLCDYDDDEESEGE